MWLTLGSGKNGLKFLQIFLADTQSLPCWQEIFAF